MLNPHKDKHIEGLGSEVKLETGSLPLHPHRKLPRIVEIFLQSWWQMGWNIKCLRQLTTSACKINKILPLGPNLTRGSGYCLETFEALKSRPNFKQRLHIKYWSNQCETNSRNSSRSSVLAWYFFGSLFIGLPTLTIWRVSLFKSELFDIV